MIKIINFPTNSEELFTLEERQEYSDKMLQALIFLDHKEKKNYKRILRNLYRLKIIKYIEIGNETYKILSNGRLKLCEQ